MAKVLYTSPKRLINWYFNTGSDQDQQRTRIEFAEMIIDCLMEDGKIAYNGREILDRVNDQIIPLSLFYGYETIDPAMEKMEYFDDYEIRFRTYPFDEGDSYYIVDNHLIIESCWDEQSEELHTEEKIYFSNYKDAVVYCENHSPLNDI
jgi:hypothetical protein